MWTSTSSMTLLFYYWAPLQNDTVVKSRCMQFIFWDKGAATYLIRECPDLWLKKKGRQRGKRASVLGRNMEPSPFPSFLVTGRASDQTGSCSLVPKNELHASRSLHNIIFNSFWLVLVLWRLLQNKTAFYLWRHSCSKKVLVEIKCSHSMGGVTFLALVHQNYIVGCRRHFESILHQVQVKKTKCIFKLLLSIQPWWLGGRAVVW